MEQLGKNF